MNLKFCGPAGTVTGSRYLLTHDGQQTLVDCGLFQGQKELRQRNWKELPFDASKVGTVFLTHAHIDHSGYLPVLVRRGFKGRIMCTKATLELCQLLLRDSAHLQEEEARYANKRGYSRHKPALPLYTLEDAEAALNLFQGVDYNTPVNVVPGIVAKGSLMSVARISRGVSLRCGCRQISKVSDQYASGQRQSNGYCRHACATFRLSD